MAIFIWSRTTLDSCLRPSLADTVEEWKGGVGGTKGRAQGRWAEPSGETHAAEKVPHPGDFLSDKLRGVGAVA